MKNDKTIYTYAEVKTRLLDTELKQKGNSHAENKTTNCSFHSHIVYDDSSEHQEGIICRESGGKVHTVHAAESAHKSQAWTIKQVLVAVVTGVKQHEAQKNIISRDRTEKNSTVFLPVILRQTLPSHSYSIITQPSSWKEVQLIIRSGNVQNVDEKC